MRSDTTVEMTASEKLYGPDAALKVVVGMGGLVFFTVLVSIALLRYSIKDWLLDDVLLSGALITKLILLVGAMVQIRKFVRAGC